MNKYRTAEELYTTENYSLIRYTMVDGDFTYVTYKVTRNSEIKFLPEISPRVEYNKDYSVNTLEFQIASSWYWNLGVLEMTQLMNAHQIALDFVHDTNAIIDERKSYTSKTIFDTRNK